MTIFLKFLSLFFMELIKHISAKAKPKQTEAAGSGELEKRLRDKIKEQWGKAKEVKNE